ncbi:M14 family metallopeptidase [Francisella marina]|uniref:M14 family metallocarboxypeptidase n=1 Tax=Francisella marina TaxID=2249302 RepID=A0ABX5ZKR8_9GAMM|nr:M14 family metallocarboxypeptidase [Francisella marina]QEO58009.1 M14 family metallocarboxypeptidase [Francisella marina]QEO59764.1 M14 family metallocarboxypeptidase [Francisella marina]
MSTQYHIGTPGRKWGSEEKKQWLSEQSKKRSYQEEVEKKILALSNDFDIDVYGELDYLVGGYKLYALKTKNWDASKPYVLVTGGVHGYETSGVQGAISFAANRAREFASNYNILILPCLSPWGYETINRWNPNAMDPNRSFYLESGCDESVLAMKYINSLNIELLMHIDLHETTDTDDSEFRPALAAREGITIDKWGIPDGFYLVANNRNPHYDFQKYIIDAVAKVTHIASTDPSINILGDDIIRDGIMACDSDKEKLCMSLSNAEYTTTTEVYPDSPRTNPQECILAQVEAIAAGLNFISQQK